jgi:hypothetical protein
MLPAINWRWNSRSVEPVTGRVPAGYGAVHLVASNADALLLPLLCSRCWLLRTASLAESNYPQ